MSVHVVVLHRDVTRDMRDVILVNVQRDFKIEREREREKSDSLRKRELEEK